MTAKRLFIVFVFGLYFSNTFAQMLQGEWRDHLPFHSFYRIVVTDNYVYGASVSGILSYNKSSGEIQKITKAAGPKDFLSDVQISTISYFEDNKLLVIGYMNGNVDVMKNDGSIVNLADIKRKSITGAKTINRIVFDNKSAYLACDFGIVKLDLEKFEFIGNYYFGSGGNSLKVNDIAIINNILYAATEVGIYRADLSSPNLLDYNYWEHLNYLPSASSEYKFIENYNNKLYAVFNDSIGGIDKVITLANGSFQEKTLNIDAKINDLSSSNGYLCFSGNTTNSIFDNNEALYSSYYSNIGQHIIVDSDNSIYTASKNDGFYFNKNGQITNITINSPESDLVSKIETKGDQLWVSSGGPERTYFALGLLYNFSNETWKTYYGWDWEHLSQVRYANTYKIAIDPRNYNHAYVCSQVYGIIEFLDGTPINVFERGITDIFSGLLPGVEVRAAGMQYDSKNNLWMALSLSNRPIFKLNADGTWENPEVKTSYLTSGTVGFTDILVTKNDDIWIAMNKVIIVLRENGSGGFTEKAFTIKSKETSIDKPKCMVQDHNGNIWVGTNVGPIIYYNPENVFNYSDVIATQVQIRRNDGTDLIDFLLSGETILDIKIDGGNRKWVATEKSGVFLLSPDGLKTIHNFREENSPLLSNNVSGIGIRETDGEVFFATDKGIVSFKGIATKGFDNYSNVYVYPNPVRENFNGNITITGLIENSIVKITDISGNLVYETTSLGGQAVWDGRNFRGMKVGTGVYLVFLSTEDGSQYHVTKLLLIK